MPTFNIPGTVSSRNAVANIDFNYGPYTGATETIALDAAHAAIGVLIEKGVTIGVIINGEAIQEYWYESGITRSDLKKKGSTSGVQNSSYTTNSVLVGGATTGTTSTITLTNDTALGKIGTAIPSAIPIKTTFSSETESSKNLVYSGVIKKYVDDLLSSPMSIQGGYDANIDTPHLDSGVLVSNIQKGWTWIVTVAGMFFSDPLSIGDHVVAKIDLPVTYNDWIIIKNGVTNATTTTPGIVKLAETSSDLKVVNLNGSLLNNVVTLEVLKTILGISDVYSIPRKFVQTINPVDFVRNGITYNYVEIEHNLNTDKAIVTVRQLSGDKQEVEVDIEFTTANTIKVTFPAKPSESYEIIIIG